MGDAATLRAYMDATGQDVPALASAATARRFHGQPADLITDARRRARWRDRAVCLLIEVLEGEPVTPEHAGVVDLATRVGHVK